MPGKALKGSAKFQLSPFFLDISQSQGEQVLDKKGNNILDREANHKLGREIQLQGTLGFSYEMIVYGIKISC